MESQIREGRQSAIIMQSDLLEIEAPNYASACFPDPRDFQVKAHDALRRGAAAKHRCQLVMAPTGAGKSYLGMRVIHEALLRGRSAMFVCDRTTLINQTSAVADHYGLSAHSVLQANHWRYNKHSKFHIASCQTLARRGWPEVDVIVIDECFVGETLISTTDGFIPIKDVRAGHTVYNAIGTGIVISVFSKLSDTIVTVRLSNGVTIECTEDHPFFTDDGWIKAGVLERGQGVFSIETVRSLWDNDDTSKREQREATGSRGSVQSASMLREILFQEAEKSDAFRSCAQEDGINIEKYETLSERSWRERVRENFCSKSGTFETRGRLDYGICSKNKNEINRRISTSLQDRCCEPGANDCNRGGWQQSLRTVKEKSGREKGFAAEVVWVESVTHSKSSSHRTVYNLRVSGHPSYFANGILVHNCHTQYKAWTDHVVSCSAHVVGLSATPFSAGLGRIFTNLVNAATMHELTESGVLVPMRVFSGTRINMTGAEIRGGEWTDHAAEERGMEIVGDVVTEWMKYASDRKTIVFGSTINHCLEMCRQFNESGIMAATFTCDTKPEERELLLKEYQKPDSSLRVLISVEALAKGFDVKDVECVCDCRPLRKSLSTAIQMWGRGLRSSPETGKKDCLLLDFSGNIVRFAEDYADIFYNGLSALDMGEKLDKVVRKDDEEKPEGKACPSCGYQPVGRRCVACGWEHVSAPQIEHQAGELIEFKVGKATVGDKYDVWTQCATFCRGNGKPETAAGRAAHLYKSITGVFPRNLPDFMETPNVTVSRAVINKARANSIAFRASSK